MLIVSDNKRDKITATYQMVAIFREDLAMPIGKLAAQAGHAYLQAWLTSIETGVDLTDRDQHAKIALVAPDLATLLKIQDHAAEIGVVAALIIDGAKTVFSEPTVTVLGLGPMTKTQSNTLTRGLKML